MLSWDQTTDYTLTIWKGKEGSSPFRQKPPLSRMILRKELTKSCTFSSDYISKPENELKEKVC